MGRNKQKNVGLPVRMTLWRGLYYYKDSRGGKTRLTNLGKDLDSALKAWAIIEGGDDECFFDGDSGDWARWLYARSRAQAANRGIPFDLTLEELEALAKFGRNRCAITGIPFEFKVKYGARRPWAPSLDRIDPTLGYSFQNCRLVCIAANVAISDWGTAVFSRMARGFVEHAVPIAGSVESENVGVRMDGRDALRRSMLEKVRRSRWARTITYSELSDEYWAKRLKVPVTVINAYRESAKKRTRSTGSKSDPASGTA